MNILRRMTKVFSTVEGIIAGAITGAKVGAIYGIAGDPIGAIAGTVPRAVTGCIIDGFTGNKLVQKLIGIIAKLSTKPFQVTASMQWSKKLTF